MAASRPLLLRLLALLALAAYVALGLSRVSFEVDVTRLLPQDLPETCGARLFMQHFLHQDQLLLLLETPTPEQSEASAQAIAEAFAAHPHLVRRALWQRAEDDSAALAELAAWALLHQPPEALAILEKALSPTQLPATLNAYLDQLATSPLVGAGLAGYDPLGLLSPLLAQAGDLTGASEFASADGRFRVVHVTLSRPPADYRQSALLLQELRALAQQTAPLAQLWLTGEPAFLAEIGSSMERDMKRSGGTTLLLTTLLVFIVFRRLRFLPLLALSLALTFVLTLATCGLLMGSITALTVGFGSILIGLSADYGILIYQAHRRLGAPPASVRREVWRSVLWAVATTAAVFTALLPLGFPGLSDLGLLVAVGVLIGAAVMLLLLPRLLHRWDPVTLPAPTPPPPSQPHRTLGTLALLLLLGLASGLLFQGMPIVDAASGSIRPTPSEAYDGIDQLETRLGGGDDALTLLVSGPDLISVGHSLAATRQWLENAKTAGQISTFQLPDALWPDGDLRSALNGFAHRLVQDEPRLKATVEAAGFTAEGWHITGQILAHWKRWLDNGTAPLLPPSLEARGLVDRFFSLQSDRITDSPHRVAALGSLRLTPGILPENLTPPSSTFITGSDVLNRTLDRYLQRGFVGISLLFATITLLLLAFALRSLRPFLLTAACIALSYTALLGLMSWLDLRWNAFTLPALLLSLGTGSDYFIHLILRMERERSAALALQQLRPALAVCAGSTVLGFGSLLTASSPGLASMGLVCAAALGLNAVTALLIMPLLWQRLHTHSNQ